MGVMDCWPESHDALVPPTLFTAEGADGVRPLTAYQTRPEDFCVEVLGIPRETIRWSLYPEYAGHRWDGTPDPLATALEALARGEDVGMESGTGTGKSYLAAAVALWFQACWPGARTFTFAPKEDQLRLFMWAELGKMFPRFATHFPAAVLNDLFLSVDGSDLWMAKGYPVGVKANEESSTKAQGQHGAHMLLLYEETPGIPVPVLVAGENTTTGDHNLRFAVGNPDHQQDALHQFCTSPGVRHIRISSHDHPNVVLGREVIPGAVTRKSIDRRVAKYGADSRLVLSRIHGISPSEAEDALIRRAWLDAAVAKYADERYRVGLPAWGVDVANSEAGDQGAVARGLGSCLLEVDAKACPDANVLGSDVVTEVRATPRGLAKHVGIDAVGVGAGAVNEAKRLGMLVQALHGGPVNVPTMDEPMDVGEDGRRVPNEERFASLRGQMWWQFRMDVQHGRIALPHDEELLRDLTTPTWTTKGGKIVVEPKEEIVKRLGRSPNKGDAAVYWNWVRDRRFPVTEEEEPKPFSTSQLAHDAGQGYRVKRVMQKRNDRPFDPHFGDA